MKKKLDFRIPIIIVLTIILSIMCYFYFKDDNTQIQNNMKFDFTNNKTEANNNNTNFTIISTTGEINSSLTEKMELHATYYLEECYATKNQLIKSGENILKYTNGTYLKAPYDLVITELNIPDEDAKCTNEHYIEISSVNNLKVQFKVSETKIDSIKLGQEAEVKIEAYEDKTLTGYVTNISSTASNGRFTVTVEFENDGEVLIGMTSSITIKDN